jgi:radical SAM superfamily enzyme YgiQ (UPF0313 family)
MKIALIRPNMGDYRSRDAMPPLALGILAARSGKHHISFYDDRVEVIPKSIDADLLAFSVETFTARRAYQLSDHFRSQGHRVVMGGYHPTLLPDESLKHADAVVIGDAEGSWEQLLADAEAGCMKRVYQGNNNAPLTGAGIDRAIFTNKSYVPIELAEYGRGCRFACDFCSIHSFYGSRIRVRPAAEVSRELMTLDRKRLLFFVDDNLFSSEEHLDALLTAIQPLNLRWACQISIHITLNPNLLDRMVAAGCNYVLIGFESLEPENLAQMKKSWNRLAGNYLEVARLLHQRGIGIYGTFVFGYDRDTVDTIRRCFDFALEARLEIANFNPLVPTPGSSLYARLRQENRLLSPRWWMDANYRYGDPIFVPHGMSAEVLAEECFAAKRNFYAWSSMAKRLLDGRRPFSWFGLTTATSANFISRREVYRKQGRLLGGQDENHTD